MFWKYPANLQENTHAEVRFEFAAYFQNTFSEEHLWKNASASTLKLLLWPIAKPQLKKVSVPKNDFPSSFKNILFEMIEFSIFF